MARLNPMFGVSPYTSRIVEVPISAIRENPYQPRKMLTQESIDQLSENIKEKGLLTPPIVMKTDDSEVYVLAAGQRRLRALEKLGWESIPVIIAEKGHPLEIALIENLQREDPHPVDMAESIEQLAKEFEYTHQQIANIIGEGRTTVTEWLSISKLPDEIRQACRALDTISKMHLVELAHLADQPEKLQLALEQIRQGATTRQLKTRRERREAPTRSADHPKALLPVIRVIDSTHKVRDALAKIKPSVFTNNREQLDKLKALHKEIGGYIRKLERSDAKPAGTSGAKRAVAPTEPDSNEEEDESTSAEHA